MNKKTSTTPHEVHAVAHKSSGVMKAAVVGVTLAGLAAGAYFFFGPNGKKHQKQAKSWALKMRADVIEKLEKVNDVTQETYDHIIDTVAAKYNAGKEASQEEIHELAADLKKHWKALSSGVKEVAAK